MDVLYVIAFDFQNSVKVRLLKILDACGDVGSVDSLPNGHHRGGDTGLLASHRISQTLAHILHVQVVNVLAYAFKEGERVVAGDESVASVEIDPYILRLERLDNSQQ